MVLSVCESFRYILHVHLLEYAALVGLDGMGVSEATVQVSPHTKAVW